jgi:hypothetical protein
MALQAAPMAAMLAEFMPWLIMRYLGEISYTETRPQARAADGRQASARRSRPAAPARTSSVPEPRSAASTISVSAQVATCGRPTRCPWWL